MATEPQKESFPTSLRPHVDYSRDFMDPYFSEETRNNPNDMQKLKNSMDINYTSANRGIIGGRFGFEWSINPELLNWLGSNMRGKIGLEISSASGINSLILVACGIKMYVNDIVPEEIQGFENQLETFSENIKGRISTITGDCLDLGASKEITEKVDFIICYNVFHFINKIDESRFFQSIYKHLKPNGFIIIQANGLHPYVDENHLQCAGSQNGETFFKYNSAFYFTEKNGDRQILQSTLCFQITENYTLSLNGPEKVTLRIKDRKRNPIECLQFLKSEREKLSKEENELSQMMIKNFELPDIEPIITQYEKGIVRAFTPASLTKIMNIHNFITVKTFNLDQKGHIIPEAIGQPALETIHFAAKSQGPVGGIYQYQTDAV